MRLNLFLTEKAKGNAEFDLKQTLARYEHEKKSTMQNRLVDSNRKKLSEIQVIHFHCAEAIQN